MEDRVIEVEELQSKLATELEAVAATGEGIVVTRNGKPLARILPPAGTSPAKSLYGRGRDTVRIVDPEDEMIDILTEEDIAAWYRSRDET